MAAVYFGYTVNGFRSICLVGQRQGQRERVILNDSTHQLIRMMTNTNKIPSLRIQML